MNCDGTAPRIEWGTVGFVQGRQTLVHLLLASGLAVSAISCAATPTKGTMPPPGRSGTVDASAAPDFIAVAANDGGIAGYVPKSYLLPGSGVTTGPPAVPVMPVYAEDLRTLVGHMVAGKGFVPLGVDPGTVSTRPVEQAPEASSVDTDATPVYVRNPFGHVAWLAIRSGDLITNGHGHSSELGVGCVQLPPNSHLVLLDRPPQESGARVIRVVYVEQGKAETPPIWIAIASDGAISQGENHPAWWQGEPQAC